MKGVIQLALLFFYIEGLGSYCVNALAKNTPFQGRLHHVLRTANAPKFHGQTRISQPAPVHSQLCLKAGRQENPRSQDPSESLEDETVEELKDGGSLGPKLVFLAIVLASPFFISLAADRFSVP